MRAPKCTVKDHPLVGEALCKCVVLAWLFAHVEARRDTNNDEEDNGEPKDCDRFFHLAIVTFGPMSRHRDSFCYNRPMNPVVDQQRDLARSDKERDFLLRIVQPSLIGLMDGSVSTLAPLFATAFATGNPRTTLLVGTSASIGAAISMAFAEALSDTGEETGRGHPVLRGTIVGLMTFAGGIAHTLPFFIPNLDAALHIAYVVVGVELVLIAFIRYRYFKMSFWLSVLQVVIGGALVFAAGMLIGSA